jgi:hypothetical protein
MTSVYKKKTNIYPHPKFVFARTYHQDPTKPNHTWALHGGPPVPDPIPWHDQVYQLMGIIHHGDRISDQRSQLSWEDNRRYR